MKTNIKDQIVLYTGKNGKVELRADTEKDTLWGTQECVAQLFDCSADNVSLHLKNIFKEKELIEKSVTEDSSVTARDGKQYLTKLYNLDAIIAVGYRVNSKKATKFRIWATSILREYLISSFNLNKNKLVTSDVRLEDLHEAINFIESKSHKPMKAKISVRLKKDLI